MYSYIAFVVNPDVSIIANYFYIYIQERFLCLKYLPKNDMTMRVYIWYVSALSSVEIKFDQLYSVFRQLPV